MLQVEVLIATVNIRKPVIKVSNLFIFGTALIVAVSYKILSGPSSQFYSIFIF